MPSARPLVSRDHGIKAGALCFLGTRIPVEAYLDRRWAGDTAKILREDYPGMSDEQRELAEWLSTSPSRSFVDAIIRHWPVAGTGPAC